MKARRMTYTIKEAARQLGIEETEVLQRLKDAARPYSQDRMLMLALHRRMYLGEKCPIDEDRLQDLRRELEYKEFTKRVILKLRKEVEDKAGRR